MNIHKEIEIFKKKIEELEGEALTIECCLLALKAEVMVREITIREKEK